MSLLLALGLSSAAAAAPPTAAPRRRLAAIRNFLFEGSRSWSPRRAHPAHRFEGRPGRAAQAGRDRTEDAADLRHRRGRPRARRAPRSSTQASSATRSRASPQVPKGTYCRAGRPPPLRDVPPRRRPQVVKLPMDRGEGQHWNLAPGNLLSTPREGRGRPVEGRHDPDRPRRVIPPIPEPPDDEVREARAHPERAPLEVLGARHVPRRPRPPPAGLRRAPERALPAS